MADPSKVLGTAGAVGNLVSLVDHTTAHLHELEGQWKGADVTRANLISLLLALRTKLDKIHEWMSLDNFEPHHQLVMDLDISISCCRMLINKLNAHVEDLCDNPADPTDFDKKIATLVKNGSFEELQRMLEGQTIALSLLLAACNCSVVAEQKTLLEQKSSRKVFRRIRDDSSSLYVQRDSSSMHSHWTGTLSKISRTFDFDRELFISKVYERALRGSLLDVLRQKKTKAGASPEEQRSQNIDKKLERESKKSKREVKVLLLSETDIGSTVVKQMKIKNGYSSEEIAEYTTTIKDNLLDLVESMAVFAADIGYELDDETRACASYLEREMQVNLGGTNKVLTLEAAKAAQLLWQCISFQTMFLDSEEGSIPATSIRFIEEAERVAAPNYIPSQVDMLNTTLKCVGIPETRFTMNSLAIRLFDISEQRLDQRKWIHSFQYVTNIVFCVDLTCYDQEKDGEAGRNKLLETIAYFGSIVNSRWFKRTSVVLLFCNTAIFKNKIGHTPLTDVFPDYTGGADFNKASKYIQKRFNSLNRVGLSIYPYFTEASDPANVQHMFAAVKETILNNALQESSILKAPKSRGRDAFPPDEKLPGYIEVEGKHENDKFMVERGNEKYRPMDFR